MKKLFAASPVDAKLGLIKVALENENIPFEIRNEQLSVALGEIPPSECYPELWILNDSDYSNAKKIYEDLQSS
jgi:hypothetical protein